MIRAILLALGIIHAPPVLTAAAPEFNEPAPVLLPSAPNPQCNSGYSNGVEVYDPCRDAWYPAPGSDATVRPHG